METDTRLSNEALGHEGEALRMIFEMLPSGVLVANTDGKLLFHNRAAQEILGAGDAARGGPSEWTRVFGWYLPDKATLLSPEELPLVRVLRGDEVRDELLFVRNAHRPSGVWIRVTGRAMQDTGGQITAAVIVFRDVTEGRLSQQTSVLLSQVVEQIADGVLLTDKQGFIEYVNPAFEAMTGFSQYDVRGRTPRILKSGVPAVIGPQPGVDVGQGGQDLRPERAEQPGPVEVALGFDHVRPVVRPGDAAAAQQGESITTPKAERISLASGARAFSATYTHGIYQLRRGTDRDSRSGRCRRPTSRAPCGRRGR